MSELGFRPFDADNHYYEAEDAFTKHPLDFVQDIPTFDDGQRRLVMRDNARHLLSLVA